MAEKEPKEPRIPEMPKLPQPQEIIAAAEEAALIPTSPTFVDLSQASRWTKREVEPKFSIRSRGNVGIGTVRAGQEIKTSATAADLSAPQPAALIIHQDETNPRVLYGIPTMKTSPSFLNLKWLKNDEVRANFKAILEIKQIVIPPESRMVIDVEKINHPVHKHCVKLSWTENAFVPIHDRPDSAEDNPTND